MKINLLLVVIFAVLYLPSYEGFALTENPGPCTPVWYVTEFVETPEADYCFWYYPSPSNLSAGLANHMCYNIGARSVVINTQAKAKFIAEVVPGFQNRYKTHESYYREKMKSIWSNDIWVGAMEPKADGSPGLMYIKTDIPVSYEAQFPKEDYKPWTNWTTGYYRWLCGKFNIHTASWRYAPCTEDHPVLCEKEFPKESQTEVYNDEEENSTGILNDYNEEDNDYDENEDEEESNEEKEEEEEYDNNDEIYEEKTFSKCPTGYDLFEGRCFIISSTWMSQETAADFCRKNQGSLVQVNSAASEQVVANYMRSHMGVGFGAWLAKVAVRDGKTLIWMRSRRPADYLKQQFGSLHKGNYRYSTKFFMESHELNGRTIRPCHANQRRCLKRALCETSGFQ